MYILILPFFNKKNYVIIECTPETFAAALMLSVILHFGTKNVFVLFKMLGNKPRASCILDKCFATELKIMKAESHPH